MQGERNNNIRRNIMRTCQEFNFPQLELEKNPSAYHFRELTDIQIACILIFFQFSGEIQVRLQASPPPVRVCVVAALSGPPPWREGVLRSRPPRQGRPGGDLAPVRHGVPGRAGDALDGGQAGDDGARLGGGGGRRVRGGGPAGVSRRQEGPAGDGPAQGGRVESGQWCDKD